MADKPTRSKAVAKAGFPALVSEVKGRIQAAQARAIFAVNAELVRLYWDVGRIVRGRQANEGWGAGVIPRLSRELHNELPDLKGFSERNIKLMVQFSSEYPGAFTASDPIGQPPVAQLPRDGKGQLPVAQIPWAQNVLLMQKFKDLDLRRWYIDQTLANGWSRNVLGLMIDAEAHRRHGKAVANFHHRLHAPQSDLARQTLKDPYIFDFLTLAEPFQERELETGLVRHLEKFLLELGQGFAFVGRQFRLDVGDEDFYIDLLFYHLRLRAYIVIELKKGKFKPEYAGKLNFYCNVINDRLRHPADQPTIGLILCQSQDRLLAEYSLAGINQPIGISTYELTRALPPTLKSALPTVQEIEAELSQDVGGKPSKPKRGL